MFGEKINIATMKKPFPRFGSFVLLYFIVLTLANCNTTHINKTPSKNIEGLWIGTYTVGEGEPVPAETSFFFSFSIFPDGKLSYKSKGFYQGSKEYITFADGTWTLEGNKFSFKVTTVNIAGGGYQHTQYGTANYNAPTGTLTNGAISDPNGGNAIWKMNKVKS